MNGRVGHQCLLHIDSAHGGIKTLNKNKNSTKQKKTVG
jgi:hypothetical protein